MTEYTVIYTLEVTEIHKTEEGHPDDMIRLAEHIRAQEQRARDLLDLDDVHVRKFNVLVNDK